MGGFLFQAQHNDLRRFASTHKAGGLSSCHPRHKGQDDATSPSSCPLPFLFLYGERKPTLDEAKQIEAAYLRVCAEGIRVNNAENERLFASMRAALSAMEAGDSEFYGPYIEAMRHILVRGGDMAREDRNRHDEDGGGSRGI